MVDVKPGTTTSMSERVLITGGAGLDDARKELDARGLTV
ncbi:MAG: hypothetical protein JWM12_3564 [Ilumatobacteraceae bacterium]|jgi:hypothetical protein|nr:hypothetical protein [Ilumatobacteraceae bacterium]